MTFQRPPDFALIADISTKRAFVGGHPEVVQWLTPGTKLFKWTKSIARPHGISPWWQFVESRRLATGTTVPGLCDLQEYATRLGVHDRDYARARMAVTKQWNTMHDCVAIALLAGRWGYIGKASGQQEDETVPDVYLIGGEYQTWIPNLVANDIKRISILPYLTPNLPFGARSSRPDT